MSSDTDAPRAAVTHFAVAEALPSSTLLRVRLETGRTHQIRAHLLAIGHPVCGDPEYGRAGVFGLERQFLHAARLAFAHPVTGAQLDLAAPLPPDLAAALALARGAGSAPRRHPV
jgi:23S rRNA pseudouridine1911/1915/1917 synthase